MRYGFNDDKTKVDLDDLVATAIADKVDKVEGKALSTNDYTDAEKTKLSEIEAGAEVNVNSDWSALSGDAQILNKPTTRSGYGITDVYTKTETDNEISSTFTTLIQQYIAGDITTLVQQMIGQYISSLYKFVGSVATYADLPNNANVGDVYNVIAAYGNTPAGTNWAWTGTEWDALGGTLDLSNYATKTGSEALTNKTYNGYTLAGAAAKSVDSSISDPTSVNLPTSAAVADYLTTQLGAIANGTY